MITLRHATLDDVPTLIRWDLEPHVIGATTDDPDAENAFEGIDWAEEVAAGNDVSRYWIAELDGRPIGALQIIDPAREPTHYWGEIEDGLRAIDIWIGEAAELGKGRGTEMMRQALAMCFADPAVSAVVIDPLASNERAHRFYQRLGFRAAERRLFNDEDDCLVHRLTRADWRAHLPGA
ncbi:MAG: GNAT family N-acetyltransferase [Alphaproteobacteria bacterium]|nr:GNAT family N-acetyltransferase [Alphaproteobacteria bacterium]